MKSTCQAKTELSGCRQGSCDAYLMAEVLVYISVVFVVLGVGYAAVYRASDYSIALRKSSEDIASALQVGERWRADVRSISGGVQIQQDGAAVTLISSNSPVVLWWCAGGQVFRRSGEEASVRLLRSVKSSRFELADLRYVRACRWELELEPRSKGTVKPGRVRPLFTFSAPVSIPKKEEQP